MCTVNQVLVLHERFLDSCLKECLLASQEVLTVLTKIMATCLLFAEHVAGFGRSFDAVAAELPRALSPKRPARRGRLSVASQGSTEEEAEALALQAKAKQSALDRARRKALLAAQTDFIKREGRQETFARYLTLFQDRFDKEVSEFLEKLWTDSYRSHPQLSNLCVRLDYNGYYSQKIVSEVASSNVSFKS